MLKKVLSLLLIAVLCINLFSCKRNSINTKEYMENIEEPVEYLDVEDIPVDFIEIDNYDVEKIETEDFLTDEIYIEEILVVEEKISELLVEDEQVEEILMCQTIYVPQDNIDEFVNNSQIKSLYNRNIDLSQVFKKFSIGTGIILTLVILKKTNLPEPVVSVIVGAADKSIRFSAIGGSIGTLFGGLTGATNEIDKSGRTSAIIGYATAIAGLIAVTCSLATVIPTGGATTITAGAGAKLFLTGVSVIAASVGTIKSGINAVKIYSSTDAEGIDWDSVDWKKVVASSGEKALENASDGYMCGSIIGAIYGGVDGYENYHKYNTPYSKYEERLNETPSINSKIGHWTGKRGESDFVLNEPIELSDGMKIYKVTYRNSIPDFSHYAKAEVAIDNFSGGRSTTFKKADVELAKLWNKNKYYNAGKEWTRGSVEEYRDKNGLTWHEMNNMKTMQLVPEKVNATFKHLGGISEYGKMIGDDGKNGFD